MRVIFYLLVIFPVVVVAQSTPPPPVLEFPPDDAIDILADPTLMWNSSDGPTSYTLQIATDERFTELVNMTPDIPGTVRKISGLLNNTLYHWRVSATNENGTSAYSTAWRFTTIIAAPSNPSPPDNATGVPTNPTLSWSNVDGAISYRVEVAENLLFSSLVYSQSHLTATFQQIPGLEPFTKYYWRLVASNGEMPSAFSPAWSFTTGGSPTSVEQSDTGAPTDFALHQNYPNPFNPVTTIHFSVPKESHIVLSVYNSLGVEIEVLVNRTVSPGTYQVQWIPQNIPSGTYFCRLRAPGFTSTRKLLLLR